MANMLMNNHLNMNSPWCKHVCLYFWFILLLYSAAKAGNHQEKGYPNSAYGMSKVGVTVMSFIQQRELNSKDDIVVNAVSFHFDITNLACNFFKVILL